MGHRTETYPTILSPAVDVEGQNDEYLHGKADDDGREAGLIPRFLMSKKELWTNDVANTVAAQR